MERREVLKYFKLYENYMNSRVNEGIEKYRKGGFKIKVLDKHGNPISAKITAELKNHAFNFGANIFMLDTLRDWANEDPVKYKGWPSLPDYKEKNEKYKEYFKKLFNFATLPFYWADNEPEKGKYRFYEDEPHIHRRPPISGCLKFCRENNIRTKAHCLNYDGWDCKWVKQAETAEEVKNYVEERMRICAENFAKDIKGWEVTNETLVLYPHPDGATKFFFEPDFVSWSFKTARKYFPDNKLIINDNHETVWEYFLYKRSNYYLQIKDELNNGTPIDIIGMQNHFFYKREDEMKMAEKFYNPKFIYDVLDTYADFNLPIQLTEITIPSYSNDPEDEEIQAQILKNLYSIWFSHKNMESIVYWNMVEGYLDPVLDMTQGENYYYGGFVRNDFSLKPAYETLYNLIHKQWHTKESVTGNELDFRGFYGNYDIKIEFGGNVTELSADFLKDCENEITVTV